MPYYLWQRQGTSKIQINKKSARDKKGFVDKQSPRPQHTAQNFKQETLKAQPARQLSPT